MVLRLYYFFLMLILKPRQIILSSFNIDMPQSFTDKLSTYPTSLEN